MRSKLWTFAIAAILKGASYADAAETAHIELPSAEQRWSTDSTATSDEAPGFLRHVQPLLGKAGCSNRACHGSFQGQGGFRLSLFGSDPQSDHQALLADDRAHREAPANSLILQKPTLAIDHEGGERFKQDSWQYRLLKAWIAGGAKYEPSQEATVDRLEVSPSEAVLPPGASAQLRAVAYYSDGTSEDVTGLTQFSSNDDAIAETSAAGRITAGRGGDTAIVATYGGSVVSIAVLVPMPGAKELTIDFPPNNKIDELVAVRLTQLGLTPSQLTTDHEFLRRASLDIAGTLPTPEEIAEFVADESLDKRARKIDELLERPAYAVWWTTRLCDLTGLNAPLFLGSTDFGPLIGDQWHRWMLRKVQENVPYDDIVAGMVLATSRRAGQSYDEYALSQSAYVRTVEPVDFTARDEMPHFWFRGNITLPQDKALAIAYTFLGVRLDCAQCHKHPFDRWTQQDFQQFTALFERVQKGIAPDAVEAHQALKDTLGVEKMKNAAERRQTYWRLAREGKAVPWPEVYIGPPVNGEAHATGKLLGGAEVDLSAVDDPRRPLMAWLRERDNPYFAPAFVNRVWAHYFGRGLIDPTDDHNLANPPSNRALLDHLAKSFIDHGYDMKWLHRQIAGSRVYQLSAKPNEINREDRRNLSHALVRRLPAEVVVDALLQATANAKGLANSTTVVNGRRIGAQATADERRTEFALVAFGKPLRKLNCDCERVSDPSLLQAIYLRNDQEIFKALDRKDGWLAEVKPDAAPDSLIEEAYLRCLSRPPDDDELKRCRQHFAGATDAAEPLRDLMWALLNTQEFITNH